MAYALRVCPLSYDVMSLSESDCFRSALAHLHLMAGVLMTYIKDAEVEHGGRAGDPPSNTIYYLYSSF